MPRLELKSSRSFLAIKRVSGQKVKKLLSDHEARQKVGRIFAPIAVKLLKLNASGRRINIIMLTNDTSFWLCSVSLYLSLPRKLIGLLDPSSPIRLMACAALFSSGLPLQAAVSPSRRLVVPPSRHLVMPAGCRIISHRPLVVPPYCPLIVPAGCCIPLKTSKRISFQFFFCR